MCVHVHGCPVVFFLQNCQSVTRQPQKLFKKQKKSIKTEKFFVHQERGLVQKVLSINVALC